MPELPEVEHVVRSLRRAVLGRTIVAAEINLPKLISPTSRSAFNRKLKGSRIHAISRRGKFILIELEKLTDKGTMSTQVLVVHLRMTGKFMVLTPDDSLPKHAHAVFYLDDERRLVFKDQRQFGVMRLVAASGVAKTKGIEELAPEPFSEDFSVAI